MMIMLLPQVGTGLNFTYEFVGEVISVTYDGITDEFDFSMFPDGELDVKTIETTLAVNPIISAYRKNGVLAVELLNFITDDSPDEEKYPEWIEV